MPTSEQRSVTTMRLRVPPARSSADARLHDVRPLFFSTYPPEECGLATFTCDSADAVDSAARGRVSGVIAIQKTRIPCAGDSRVMHVVNNSNRHAYELAARFANESSYNVVSLQHEFGLYPEEWGARILDFVLACSKPIVTTLHTLVADPPPLALRLVQHLAGLSQGVIVMTNAAAELLAGVYGAPAARVRVIPHGVPEMWPAFDDAYKSQLGLAGRQVICTFGLINRGKGLEHMIDAMPGIVAACPDVIYLIVGVTHPQVKRYEGEVYRAGLARRAAERGVSNHVRFINEYLSLPELLVYLQASDLYVTPYPGKDQISSGTLAYAMAAGLPVVSTPYVYAREVLADGRGLLVPFGDPEALANATLTYLRSPKLCRDTAKRVREYVRPMLWPHVGFRYLDFFREVVRTNGERLDGRCRTVPGCAGR